MCYQGRERITISQKIKKVNSLSNLHFENHSFMSKILAYISVFYAIRGGGVDILANLCYNCVLNKGRVLERHLGQNEECFLFFVVFRVI